MRVALEGSEADDIKARGHGGLRTGTDSREFKLMATRSGRVAKKVFSYSVTIPALTGGVIGRRTVKGFILTPTRAVRFK